MIALVEAVAVAGDLDRAEQIARFPTDRDEQVRALAALAEAVAAAGDPDWARRLAADAEQIARSLTDPDDQVRR